MTLVINKYSTPIIHILETILIFTPFLFPAFSPSVFFSGVFVQFYLFNFFILLIRFQEVEWVNYRIYLILATLVGFSIGFGSIFSRNSSLFDVGYLLIFIYVPFLHSYVCRRGFLWFDFLSLFVFANFLYSVLQIIMYYSGFAHFTNFHSNIPSQKEAEYTIPLGSYVSFPRFSGLFNESGPLVFFSSIAMLVLIELRELKGVFNYAIILSFTMILFSQSKFSFLFIPVFILEMAIIYFCKRFFAESKLVSKVITGVMLSVIFLFAYLSFDGIDHINNELSVWLPSFFERSSNLERSSKFNFEDLSLGVGFTSSSSYRDSQGLDILSVVGRGLGLPGLIIIFILISLVFSYSFTFSFSFLFAILLGMSSNGSLLISHYVIFLVSVLQIKYLALRGMTGAILK